MRVGIGFVLVACVLASVPVAAELKLEEVEIAAGKTYNSSMRSSTSEVLHVTLRGAPKVARSATVIAFGQEGGMEANCSGQDCLGSYTVFCSKAGALKGYVKNFQSVPVKVTIYRVECEGKDKQSLMCPTDPRLVTRACR